MNWFILLLVVSLLPVAVVSISLVWELVKRTR